MFSTKRTCPVIVIEFMRNWVTDDGDTVVTQETNVPHSLVKVGCLFVWSVDFTMTRGSFGNR